jgi:hypothetical protein
MKNTFKAFIGIAALIIVVGACQKQEYSMGDLTAPSNVVITTEVVGTDATHPNGDGSGDVKISISADNALTLTVDYDANDDVALVLLPNGSVTKKYTKLGTHTYRITAVASGKGGTSSSTTKEITVRFDYAPDPAIVTALTGDASKTWVVDRTIPAHFGVGPYNASSVRPEWWAGGVNEKKDFPCFYDAKFKFTKVAVGSYSLTVTTDNAFTKTGAYTTLPGIPASGAEGCYPYPGGTSAFAFLPASSGIPAEPSIPANSPSTQVSMLLAGVNTYIGYGACQKEYEILTITDNSLYLRGQGTGPESGNAWYIKMVPVAK